MKILLVNTLYEPFAIGGAEFSTKILAEGLAKEHEVYVVTAGLKNEVKQKNGVVIIYKKIPHIFNRYYGNRKNIIVKAFWRLYEYFNFYPFYLIKSICERIEPDVVHTNNIAMFTPRIWQAASDYAKVVHTTRDYYLICSRSSMMKSGRRQCKRQCTFCRYYTHNFRNYKSYVDEFVFISQHVKKQHRKYCGVDGTVIYNATGDLNSTENKYLQINERDELVLGYIGLISKLKGVDRIIRLANSLKVPTVLAGDIAAGEDKLKKKISESEFITYLGFTDQKSFFKKIDLLLHLPRWEEPMGRTIVEAFSFGKPVITLKKGGLKDLVEDEVDGFYIDENNFINQVRDIIKTLQVSPERYSQMSGAALKASDKFSTKNYLDNYLDLYR